MSDFIISMHIFYFIIMITGSIYFYVLSRKPKQVPLYEYAIAMVIPAWSGAAYLSIALGQGLVSNPDKTIYFARYIDWVVTTPLLLVALALTAMLQEKNKNKTLLFALIISDVFMILTGLIADFSNDSIKYIWYILGMIALVIILVIIWYPLRKIADAASPELSRHYKRIALYLSCFWILYPTAWLAGSSGIDITHQSIEIAAFIILPIFSKIGFSILDLHGLRNMHLPT
ncbi:bacteriorhodopsin [Pontibacillus salicampi]|uniref:Bacteriorhodopsin n=1 Tax=Pontibacillus salicampi TaxID=1449801 RepID=A0ABV6LKK4_9BACI